MKYTSQIRALILLGAMAGVDLALAEVSYLSSFESEDASKVASGLDASHLTLRESIQRALISKLNLATQTLELDIALDNLPAARAIFAPVISVNTAKTESRDDFSKVRNNTRETEASVAMRLRSGGEIKLSSKLNSVNNNLQSSLINPSYNSDTRIILNQPLLKGFGSAIMTLSIRNAKLGVNQAQLHYLDKALDIVQSTETAYYKLIEAREQVDIVQTSLQLAQALLNEAQSKLAAGTATTVDMLEAQVGVTNARQRWIEAKANVKSSEDGLRALMDPSQPDLPIGLIGIDESEVVLSPNTNASYKLALNRHPGYRSAINAVSIARLEVENAQDNLKPSLNLELTMGLGGGPKESANSAFKEARSGNKTERRIGLYFSYPFGRQAEQAKFRQSSNQLTEKELRVQQLEHSILINVREAIRKIEISQESVQLARLSVDLSQYKYEVAKKRFEVGLSTSRLVLEGQRDLESARLKELEARLQLLSSLAALRRIEGTSLEYHHLALPR